MIARPLWGNVLVKEQTQTKTTKAGLVLPDHTSSKDIVIGEVQEVGSGSLAFDGSPIGMEIQIKSKILFPREMGREVEVEGEKYIVVEQKDVLLVI